MAATAAPRAMNGTSDSSNPLRRPRFADIPASIDIPVSQGEDEEDEETAVVEVDPDALPDDPTELCDLLENEKSARKYWMHIARAYAKQGQYDVAIEIVSRALAVRQGADQHERLPMLHCLTWLFLQRSREVGSNAAAGDGSAAPADSRNKEYYLQLAAQALNESTRLDPSSAINTLARGVYSVFKSSSLNTNERQYNLETASKVFEEVARTSSNTNMVALMGKARVHFAKKRYDKALENYQEVLLRRPDMDPDPRIGIGMCFWCLGYKDDAKVAWERALSIDPDSKVAHVLIATYYLDVTSKMSEHDPSFMDNYRRVMDHTQKAYKLDRNFSQACTVLASHFFAKKGYSQCETLCKKALEYSDVAAITSDAWYTMARTAHAQGDHEKALSYYRKADQTREGGWYPARIGLGQVQILMKNIPAARLTFEAAVHDNPKCLEAKTILGSIYAHEVLSNIPRTGFIASKDDVTELHRKAITLLESVRNVWKSEQRIDPAAEGLLLTLARLYENESPDKALQCLQAVENIYNEAKEADAEVTMPLQLLNNMAVLYWHQEKYDKARDLYQKALEMIPQLKEKDPNADTDALATTLTYNLGRCEEAAGNTDEAVKHYEQLLQFHADYVDANMRLAYISLRRGAEDGPKKLKKLMETDGSNLEVRSLYGWFLGKTRKKPPTNPAEDHEQRHYKHSLQNYDKHDRYSLAGMGNIYLQTAREMRRDSEADKEKRRKTYEKAVEFFDKVLQLDPKNAYAAQGIAIAMIEDRKDMRSAVGILSKVRETLHNDHHAVVNLGHCLAALEQWGRAIENYETALQTTPRDPTLLSCLGRVYYAKGKKSAKLDPVTAYDSLLTSLSYTKRALSLHPDSPIHQFNTAFLQGELVEQILHLSTTQRTVEKMESAAKELDEAVETLMKVAKHKTPPYPPKDLEQRANMCKTRQKQLGARIAEQRKYEEEQAARLAEARKKREEELRIVREKKEAEERRQAEEKRRLAEERQRIVEEARTFAERKLEEERERDERLGEEREGRKRKKGEKSLGKSRKKRDVVESDSETDEDRGKSVERSSSAKSKPQKKRKLMRGGGEFKSAETVHSSDEEDDDLMMAAPATTEGEKTGDEAGEGGSGEKKKRGRKVVDDDEDEDEDGDVEMNDNGNGEEEGEKKDGGLDDLFGDDE